MRNDRVLALETNDALPMMTGLATAIGALTVGPASITFLVMPDAKNAACR